MRRARLTAVVIAIASVLAAAPEARARYVGNLNLFAGETWLNHGDWAPVDRQRQFGLMLAFAEERAPILFSADVFSSKDAIDDPAPPPGTRVKGSTDELAFGVRKVWNVGATHPHLGAGADIIHIQEELSYPYGSVTNEDRAYGAWVDCGVTWRLAGHLNLGLETRYSYAVASLGFGPLSREVQAGGIHVGLLFGYGW